MARTFIRQDVQINSSNASAGGYIDNTAPAATMESGAASALDDFNNLRSMIHHLLNVQTGNWYDAISIPATLETGTQRGVDDLNDALHVVEKKRVLRDVVSITDVTVGGADNFVILATGELPAQTTAAVGAVTTLGTIVAAHGGTFGTHSVTEVAGTSSLNPKNLCNIVDGSTRDPILSSGRTIYALLQGESGVTDGATITDTTTTRVQLSFVRINATGDDLEACPAGDIQGLTINYTTRERVRLENLNEADFLRGAVIDVPAGVSATRQIGYDGQGATPVDLTTNSILDLEGAGLTWQIRDDLQNILFQVIEGSSGGTSQVQIAADTDVFNIDAVVNDFVAGVTLRSGGTRPITVGLTDGVVQTTAGDLMVKGFGELLFDDANQTGSTWAQDGIKLSETMAEWDTFETNFGEVSLLNALNQASAGAAVRTKVQAVMTADVAADIDVNGPTYDNNCDTDLPPYDAVPTNFVTDVEVYVNGVLQRNGANAAANNDVYPGTTPSTGDLMFEFALIGTGGNEDVLTVIVNGQ